MILYHYCSPEAFLGIIQGRKLWLSNLNNMSDYLEGSWVVSIINEVLPELASKYDAEAIDMVARAYNAVKFSPYVCCFSEDGDLLSQWRGYASDGHGFAIGFDSSLFPRAQGIPRVANFGYKDSEKPYLAKIDYDHDRQKSYVKSLLELAIRHEEEKDNTNINLVFEQYEYLIKISQEMGLGQILPYSCGGVYGVIKWLAGYAVIAKNPAFHEELEYRLIHAPLITASSVTNETTQSLFELSDPKYRVANGNVCAYYEFDFSEYIKDGIIREIVLGPKNRTSERTLKAFFGKTEKSDVEIRWSRASYR